MKHLTLHLFFYFLVLISCYSCSNEDNVDLSTSVKTTNVQVPNPGKLKLLFQTGFERELKIVVWGSYYDKNYFEGKTAGLEKSDWSNLWQEDGVKAVSVNYTGGDRSKRYMELTKDPKNSNNTVLLFCLKDSYKSSNDSTSSISRVQLGLHELTPRVKELYQTVKIFISEDFRCLENYPNNIPWCCTLTEFWNDIWWEDYAKFPFRINLGIAKNQGVGQKLYFTLNGQYKNGEKKGWGILNDRVPVPIGEWFTMRYHFVDGDYVPDNSENGNVEKGRFGVTIQVGESNQVITLFEDSVRQTRHIDNPFPQGLRGYEPLKLYAPGEIVEYVKKQGKSMKIYWDDLQIWRD